MTVCVIKVCRSYKGRSKAPRKVTFHRIPTEPLLRKRWIDIIQKSRSDEFWKPTKNSVVCSDHFHKKDKYFSKENGRLRLKKGTVPSKALFISSVQSDVSDVSDNEKNTLKVNASWSSTTLPKETPSKIKASLPEAKDIITSVYHYLQTEYENLKSYTGGSCDFGLLANILKRTAAATGVSEQTVTAVIQDSKQSEESKLDTVPCKRAKLSHDIKHECVRPIKEMSSCGSAKDAEHPDRPDSRSQFDVEEHPLEMLKVEVHDYVEHHSEFWLQIEPSSTQKEPAKHQSLPPMAPTRTEVKQEPADVEDHEKEPAKHQLLPPTAPTGTEVKQEPVDVEDHKQLEGGDAVEDTASVEDPVCESAADIHHLLCSTYDIKPFKKKVEPTSNNTD